LKNKALAGTCLHRRGCDLSLVHHQASTILTPRLEISASAFYFVKGSASFMSLPKYNCGLLWTAITLLLVFILWALVGPAMLWSVHPRLCRIIQQICVL